MNKRYENENIFSIFILKDNKKNWIYINNVFAMDMAKERKQNKNIIIWYCTTK